MIPPNIIRQDEVNVIFVRSELDDAGLNPFEFRVYAHIARRSNCYAKMDNIGAICGMSGRQARRSLASLAEKGMIELIERAGSTHMITLMPPRNWSESVWSEIRKNRSGWGSEYPNKGTDSQSGEGGLIVRGGRTDSPPKDIPLRESPLREGEQPSDFADGEARETASPRSKPPVSHPKNSAPPPPTPRPRNLLGETMLEVCWGIADYTKATVAQWSLASKTIKELKQVQPDLTPEMLREFATRMRREWDGRSFTPAAFTKHWRPIPVAGIGLPESNPFPGSGKVTTADLVAKFPSGPEQAKWRRILMEQGRY